MELVAVWEGRGQESVEQMPHRKGSNCRDRVGSQAHTEGSGISIGLLL